jgi:5-methylcytosine-specific restriction endonuclease McrA
MAWAKTANGKRLLKARKLRHRKTARYNETTQAYNRSHARTESLRRYNSSDKRRANSARFARSEKGQTNNATRYAARKGILGERVSRRDIWRKDGGICYLCEGSVVFSAMHLDHELPLKRGGQHTFENCRCTHGTCNAKKKDKLVSDLRLPFEVPA